MRRKESDLKRQARELSGDEIHAMTEALIAVAEPQTLAARRVLARARELERTGLSKLLALHQAMRECGWPTDRRR